jgi:phenylalanyl-tRNA synthetase alpha chain
MSQLTSVDQEILEQARAELSAAGGRKALDALRVKYLGRKGGAVQARFDALKRAPADERRALGASANALRKAVEAELDAAGARLSTGGARRSGATVDVSLPGLRAPAGVRHILAQTMERLVEAAATLGFSVAEGPEVETEEHNFDALNIPLDHPSHDPFDTFYLSAEGLGDEKRLLRSHTSPVQVRAMRAATGRRADTNPLVDTPPLRVVVPGRVYRPDAVDATHYHTFHQLEGLAVDRDITVADLRHTLELFARGLFGAARRIRLRPSFFPFTEPSAEVDVSCPFCAGGAACAVCKSTGWIEMLGCGMVHPEVLAAGGYDPARTSGFAFGMGVERIAMLRHGVRDIRLFIDPERGNDLRFLEQF